MILNIKDKVARLREKYAAGILGDTLVYGLGAVISRGLSFLTVPVMAKSLAPETYGIIDLLVTLTAGGLMIASLNFEPPLTRYYYAYKERQEERVILSTLTIFLVAAAAFVTIGGMLAWEPISHYLHLQVAGRNRGDLLYLLVLLSVLPKVINSLGLTILRLERWPGAYSVCSCGYGIIFLVSLVSLGYLEQLTPAAYFATILASEMVLLLSLVWTLREHLTMSLQAFSWKTARLLFSFGLQQAPSVVITWVLVNGNRFFMSGLSTLHEIGLYAFAFKIMGLTGLVGVAFQMSWAPYYMSICKESTARERYIFISRRYLTLFAVLVVILICLAPELVMFLGSRLYLESIPAMGLVGVYLWLEQAWLFTHIGSLIAERPWILSLARGVGLLVFLLATFLLVGPWGAVGAAMAQGISVLFAVIFCGVLTKKIYPISYPFTAGGLVLLLLLGTVAIAAKAGPSLLLRGTLAMVVVASITLCMNCRDFLSYLQRIKNSPGMRITY